MLTLKCRPTSPSPSRPPTPSLVRPDSSAICSSGSDDSHEEAGRVITPSPSSGRKIRFAPLPDPKRARSYSTGRDVWLDPNDPTSQRVTTRDDSLERRTTGEPMSRVRSAPTTSGSRPQETVDGFYTGPLLQPGGVSRTESHTGGFSPGSLPSSAHTRSGSTSSSFSRKFLAPLVGLGGSSRGSNATDESDDTSPIRRGNSGSSFNSDALLTPGSDSGASGFGAALAPSTSPRVSYPSVAQRSGGRRRAQPSSASKNEPVFQEWDFGGKSSSAHFNSSVVGRGGASFRGGSAPDHDAEDDDDGSGMAWLKRRKAERERKAKEEAEAAAAGVEVKKEVEEEEMTASPASQVTTPPIPIAGASPTKPSHRPTPSIEIDGVDVGKVTQQPDRPVMDENAVEDDDDEDDEGSNGTLALLAFSCAGV